MHNISQDIESVLVSGEEISSIAKRIGAQICGDYKDSTKPLVFLVILQQVEGNVIYPKVVGTSIGLPGIWVLAAVTVGGGLMGLVGVLLSVPIASVLYTLLRRDVHWRLDRAS